MKNTTHLLLIILAILFLSSTTPAKILLIVENSYYNASISRITRFAADVQQFDNQTLEIVPWTLSSGTNIQQCRLLWNYLESQYSSGNLEGAVLLGNIPVPQTYVGSATEPFDYYYMDIWDSRTNSAYPNHDMTPFNTDPTHVGYFSKKYNVNNADSKLDIWVSRIYGTKIAANQHLRSSAPGGNPNTILNEAGIYNEYLDRLHKRYAEPAPVPSRGFAIGGTGDLITPLQDVLNMHLLDLPMYVEFNGGALSNTGEANPFNFVSQLQSGPQGGITYGAYNRTVFPSERNARNCTYSQLTDARSYAPYNNRVYSSLDNNGWEWVGIFTHSNPGGFAFNYIDNFTYNGSFSSGTTGPFWGNSMRRTGGYIPSANNPSGYYYYYNPNGISTDPFGYTCWRDKAAFFQYKVRATGKYSVYIYYSDAPQNCSNAEIHLVESELNASGYPSGGTPVNKLDYDFSMKTHVNRDGSSNWERVFYNVKLTANNMITVKIDANGQDGEVIADAVRFVCTSPTIDDKVDNVEPLANPSGSSIFSTPGFYTSDCINRSFHSMQDENGTSHNKFSKVPFFLTSTCHTNNFLYHSQRMDNIGNLLALGHNGLICMGTSDNNYPGRGYTPFTYALASNNSFGKAFLEQANSSFKLDKDNNLECMYALLGAGTLRAKPYIQYGSTIQQNQTISDSRTVNSGEPVVIRGVTVTSSGTWNVSSNVTTANPNLTNSEIVIRPETVFQTGSNITIKTN